ncbi:hypothetical protein RINTHH_3780 [Richelia intracellularis HH01]|uniref:Uncharacterized protein n=1 Tax=Richelia intracellularis HH01 TaxID=1165094 RepID=M1WZ62_9NOST|nr:hypothetical protein [Richelia intracellularis]CCH66533.1 hypothetical protein RINTHH_3780 [Richelia intracellularis HH01]
MEDNYQSKRTKKEFDKVFEFEQITDGFYLTRDSVMQIMGHQVLLNSDLVLLQASTIA